MSGSAAAHLGAGALASAPATHGAQIEEQAPLVLRLRLPDEAERSHGSQTERERRVVWDDSVVDNEHMNKKKSNKCCIFHKRRAYDESSSSSSDSDDSDIGDNSRARGRHSKPPSRGPVAHRKCHNHDHDHSCGDEGAAEEAGSRGDGLDGDGTKPPNSSHDTH